MHANKKTARIAGLLYLAIIAAGVFAEFIVRGSLIVPGNAAATAGNILASESLFRLGIAGDLIMLICDVALALVFFVLLKPVSRSLSLLAAFFRLAQAAVLGMNLLNLVLVLQLISGTDYLAVFGAEQLQAQAMLFLQVHAMGYTIGLVFFSMNCFLVGYLVFKSGYFPRFLGVLMGLAGAGYLFDAVVKVLRPDFQSYETIMLAAVFLAEVAMCLWLLVKGMDDQPQEQGIALNAPQVDGSLA